MPRSTDTRRKHHWNIPNSPETKQNSPATRECTSSGTSRSGACGHARKPSSGQNPRKPTQRFISNARAKRNNFLAGLTSRPLIWQQKVCCEAGSFTSLRILTACYSPHPLVRQHMTEQGKLVRSCVDERVCLHDSDMGTRTHGSKDPSPIPHALSTAPIERLQWLDPVPRRWC